MILWPLCSLGTSGMAHLSTASSCKHTAQLLRLQLSQRHGNVCTVIRNNVYTDMTREDERQRCGGEREEERQRTCHVRKFKQHHRCIIREKTSPLLNFSLTALLHKNSWMPLIVSYVLNIPFFIRLYSLAVTLFCSCVNFLVCELRPRPVRGKGPVDQRGGSAGGSRRCDGPCPRQPCAPARRAAARQEWSSSGQIYWRPSCPAVCHPETQTVSLSHPATDKTQCYHQSKLDKFETHFIFLWKYQI